jgi:hypothetical protein
VCFLTFRKIILTGCVSWANGSCHMADGAAVAAAATTTAPLIGITIMKATSHT